MKIVMLCEFYSENLEYQENLLVKYYMKHDHHVTVITSTYESVFDFYVNRYDPHAPAKVCFDKGAKIIRLPYRYNLLNKLRAYTHIDGILEEEAPDLIFVHDIIPNFPEAVRYMKRHPRCRMIMDYHSDYSNSGKNILSRKILHGVARKWFLDRARPHLSRIFPVVPAAAVFLHEIYKVPHSEMELLPLGADTDLGYEVRNRQEGKALRQTLGISSDDVVIFTGGKLAPAKKVELLIEAVSQLEGRRFQLVIIGDADNQHESYKQMLVRMAGERRNIRFAGWLDRRAVYRYLDMADMAVFPASQSILWQQAIAAGLPLIVGDSGDQDISYLNHHQNIIILRKSDIRTECLVQAIDGVISSPSRMREMSAGAFRVSDEHLNWDKLILKTLRFNEPTMSNCEYAR